MFIPETGVAANHHFLPPLDRERFTFPSGSYGVEVLVKEVGKKPPYLVFTTRLDLSGELAAGLAQSGGRGVFFEWGPDSGCYHSHLSAPPPRDPPVSLRDLLLPVGNERSG